MTTDTQIRRPAQPSARLSLGRGSADTFEVVEWEALFTSCGAACYNLARSIIRDPNLAEDVVQEVFLQLWLDTNFDATRSTPVRWLLMLTHRKAVDRIRHEERRKASSLEAVAEQVSAQRGPEDLAMAHVLAPKVRAALATLPQVQQEVLALAYWGGYTQREVAGIIGVPLGTVKTRMRNGMFLLRTALRDERC